MKARMSDATDEMLVDLARKGDLEAYSELVRRYRERIYHTIFRFTKNHGDADDLAQETFLRAFRNLRRFRRKSSFYTWLFRIAVNQSLNFLKKRKQEMGREEWNERRVGRERSILGNPESASLATELSGRLNEAIDGLAWPYRSAFNLVVFQGMSHAEAARILRCSENTVSWRMHRARKLLQAKMRPYLDGVHDEMPDV
jgi:RNA polymerase sigma-70 factor (ECF subfamily)